jgi:hypothetical protein
MSFALLTASSALAVPSSTLYPPGDSVSASSVPISLALGGIKDTCTLTGGAFTIPAASHNPSGPVVLNYATRPTITECSGNTVLTVTTQNAWKLNAQYGEASPTVTIPINGLVVTEPFCGDVYNKAAVTIGGAGWFNGFTSPVNVGSAIAYGGAATLTCLGNGTERQLTLGTALQTLTDTTHPGSLPLLGP